MEATPWTLRNYKTVQGKEPFAEWLGAQDGNVQGLVQVRLKRVENGNFGDHHGEGEGIWALIFDVGPGYRVYYGLVDNRIVLLLTAGGKKRQGRDIVLARKYWEDFKANDF